MDKDDDGFETLLRPVQLALTTDWGKTIKSYLQKYLVHLCGLYNTNFSEAALILQNSIKLYCKRIELLYSDFLSFIVHINEVGSGDERVDSQTRNKGRKCVAKSFHNDDLKVLDLIHSEHNIDINLEKNGKNGTGKKTVILNPSVKIPIKAGTACQIYQSDGKEFGYKDEFRLFWPITSTGFLSEDFHLKDECLVRFAGSILEESNANFGDSSYVNDEPCDINQDDEEEFEAGIADQQPSTNEPPDPGNVSPSFTSPPSLDGIRTLHQRQKKDEKVKAKALDWDPISTSVVLPLRKLRIRKVFKLPRQLVADVIQERKKRKRKSEVAENVNDVLVMSDILYQNEIMDGGCEGLKIKCNLAKKTRKALTITNRLNGVILNGDIRSEDIDELDEECADEVYVSDPELEEDASSPLPLQLNGLTDMAEDRDRIDAAVLYLDSALSILAKYNALKKKICIKSTELARRVSEWHESIIPALEAAESRSIFNVHEYGTKILDFYSDDDTHSVIQFDRFVKKQPKEEICRFLLASLMLANTYNVEIKKSNDHELAKDCLQLRLLSKVRHHDLLNENIGAAAAESYS